MLRAGTALSIERCGAKPIVVGQVPEVKIRRVDAAHVSVKLLAPEEPQAWAIDAAGDGSPPFVGTWHSERTPGTRATAAKREAVVAHARGPIAIRVYGDDGSIATRLCTEDEISAESAPT